MKNNGYTLIELLAVIVILGIIMVIAVPVVSYLVNGNNDEYYSNMEKTIKTSGEDYFLDNREVLPKKVGNTSTVTIDTLTTKAYIDKVKDENNDPCNGNVTVKKTSTNKYEYVVCLICNDEYTSDNCN